MRRFMAPSQQRPSRPSPSSPSTPPTTATTSATTTSTTSTSSAPGMSVWRFGVIHCRSSGRKHKKWEDDGLLEVHRQSRLAILRDAANREICRASGFAWVEMDALRSGAGASIAMGGRDVEIVDVLCMDNTDETSRVSEEETRAKLRPKVITEAVFNQFSMPKMTKPMPPVQSTNKLRMPVHDPSSPKALVLPTPPDLPNESCVDVVVDPYLSRHLRGHQKEGVTFLYKCLMGFNEDGNKGAILADDMGLGKTLQTIAVLWTMLKQSPIPEEPSVIKRALILTPSSLVKNWRNEFIKWLGSERIRVFAVDKDNKVGEYIKYKKSSPVLIMSYEMFVRSVEELATVKFDVIVCDEGHRLKNDKIKASALLANMSDVERRVVLTGTPLQNDLKEFYALVCVVNPSVLGSSSTFARHFEAPILNSKQPDASEEDKELGQLRLGELNEITNSFILRRSQDVIKNFLPQKTEYILFCRPTQLQRFLYKQALQEVDADALYSLDNKCVLGSIQDLRKICNHPVLYGLNRSELSPELVQGTLEQMSGKLAVVSCLLHYLHSLKDERIVLVSISTQVLDLLASLCDHYDYKYLRLDGSTSAAKRQSIVDDFNSRHCQASVLLLSSKAGGTGLNLIGAASILLYDMDWNPAHDIQAMARVWRDGQRKPVNVYRLATTGSVEEKILQRQLTKQSLADQNTLFKDSGGEQFEFSLDELRDLFSFRELEEDCDTHKIVCQCGGDSNDDPNDENTKPSLKTLAKGLSGWEHLKAEYMKDNDLFFQDASSYLTFVFKKVHSTLGQEVIEKI